MEFKHYGEIIHKIRQDRNMTLKEAAGDAITPNNLSRFEKGLATVKVDTFFEILKKFNLELADYAEVLHIKDEDTQRSRQFLVEFQKQDLTKARQILGKKSDWGNTVTYYALKLVTINETKTLDKCTPDEVEAIHYLIDYISKIDTLYISDFVIIELLFNVPDQFFELKFLEYLEKLIIKGLEERKYVSDFIEFRYANSGASLARAYSRYGYYDKAEKLIYKLKLILSQRSPDYIAIHPILFLNIYEVYNLLRQNNPKAIERANTLLHYIDAQNNLFPLAWMFETKNIFVQEVKRLNKTGIPFPPEDEK
ncbi:MAG: helix-turn-helix transcriptional regulator [Staphylococcus warneri]|nr:helix-turn-helix transcriptional regulator [Staphylococcus warneri]